MFLSEKTQNRILLHSVLFAYTLNESMGLVYEL